MKQDQCQITVIHQDAIDKVKEKLISDTVVQPMSRFFKIFGDETRLKILNALSISELCVCDLSVLLDMQQSAISHQLRILKQEHIVKYRKEGKVVYYSLEDLHVEDIFNQGLVHIMEKYKF